MDLELMVVQRSRPEFGYLASLVVGDDLIALAGGTTRHAPTVLASSDALHFESRTTPRQLGLRDIMIDGDALWTCGEYGQLAVSRDRGESWQLLETGTDACLFGLACTDGGALWVCGGNGYFARVRDEGVERIDLGTTAHLAAIYAVRDELIALGADGVLYRWRNGAVTRTPTGATRPLTALAITKKHTWLVTGDGGFIARSPDGAWFSRATSGVEVDLESIATLADGRIAIVGDRGLVLLSRDEGRTWHAVANAEPAHLWSIEPFGSGALIGGDGGLIMKLAPAGDQTWQGRGNVFGGSRPLDAAFARGPDDFVAAWGASEPTYADVYGMALPPLPTRGLHDLRLEPVSTAGFEARVLADQRGQGTALTDAFCGTVRIGSQRNGDSYHLELYEWDGPRQVLHFDHEARAFSGVVADSLDSLVFLSALSTAHAAREISDGAFELGLRQLQGRVAPTLDAKRRDTEFFFYRARWITALLENVDIADIPTLFMADFNQIVPPEQLSARLEGCEKVIPTALYSMWRAYLFDEPELPHYLDIGRRHRASLVRDAAALIDELRAGRNTLGTITDVRARLAAFRQLDLDPRRADARHAEASARRQAVEAELATGNRNELAWRWLDDGVAHRALLAQLGSELEMVETLPDLPDDERELVIARVAETLSPALEAILVGAIVRDDDLAGALPADDAAPIYRGVEPHAQFDGVSVYLRDDHFHFVTDGLREFGFELTLRVARVPAETTPQAWAVSLLQNVARYVFSTGNRFDVGHKMGLHGPIAPDSKLTAIAFARDPELKFLQVIGITDDEYKLTQEWMTSGLVEILRANNPWLFTDIHRDSVLADPAIASMVRERVESEGSSEDMSFAGDMTVTLEDGIRIDIGALYAPAIARAMRGRLRHGRSYTLRGKAVTLKLTPGPQVAVIDHRQVVELICSPALVREVDAQLGFAGTYRFESWPALELNVVPTVIRDQADNSIEVKGAVPARDQVRAALAMTERALALAPDDEDTLFTHAILLLDAETAGIRGGIDALLQSLPRHSPHNRLNIALRIHGARFADAFDAVVDELPDDEELLLDLFDAVVERAPDRVGRLIAELPDSVNLLSTAAYNAIVAEREDAAFALYDRVLSLPFPDDDSVERTNYLRALNNACVKAHAAKAYDLAVRIADRSQPFAHENPHIYHSAACAYAAVGNLAKAFEQVKLAVAHNYEELEKLETDHDLGALLDWPEFKALFRDWHARREGN